MQLEAPAALKLPAAQIWGALAPLAVMYPAGVVMGAVLPISETNDPGGVGMQLLSCVDPMFG